MQLPTNRKTKKVRPWLLSTLFFTVVMAGVFLVGLSQQRAIADWFLLHNYQAPARVDRLATQDTMTDKARRIFYVNRPVIEDRSDFIRSCPSGTQEKTIVLGCYRSDQAGIFLLNVSDSRLDGVKRVTAAHEMLHAAYDRLNADERKSIDAQLEAYYKNGLTDTRIKSTIDLYKVSEPKDVVNEMHSIFGTEVADLPKGLEQYYQHYFTNRKAIVAFSANYQSEFTSRRDQVAKDDARLKQLKADIDDREAALKSAQSDISNKQSTLMALRNNNNLSAYNAGVPAYNASVADYNNQVAVLKDVIVNYNTLVAERNAIALEEDQLVKSLSAQSETINN